MGSSQGVVDRKDQSQKHVQSNEVNEEQYWQDFFWGKSLKKYGDETITTYHIDKFAASDLWLGTY